MNSQQMKMGGIVCLVICAICIFVAIERYSSNANNVRAMNEMRMSSPFGGGQLKPATPATSKYAMFFALLSGVGGAAMLARSSRRGTPPSKDETSVDN